MKFTFRDDPRHRYLRGTLLFEVNFTTLPPKSTQLRMVIILMRSAKVGEMRQGSPPRLERCDKAVTQPPHNHQPPKSPALQAKRCYRPLAHITKPGFHAEKGVASAETEIGLLYLQNIFLPYRAVNTIGHKKIIITFYVRQNICYICS